MICVVDVVDALHFVSDNGDCLVDVLIPAKVTGTRSGPPGSGQRGLATAPRMDADEENPKSEIQNPKPGRQPRMHTNGHGFVSWFDSP